MNDNVYFIGFDSETGELGSISKLATGLEKGGAFITVSEEVGLELLSGEKATGDYYVDGELGELKEKIFILDVLAKSSSKFKQVKEGKRADIIIEHDGNKLTFTRKEGITDPLQFVVTDKDDSNVLLGIIDLPLDNLRHQATLIDARKNIAVWCEKVSKAKLKASE